ETKHLSWSSNYFFIMSISFKEVSKPSMLIHDATVVDLVFVMDTTGSMGSYIKKAKDCVKEICSEIVKAEKSDLQLALIEYRDFPPQDHTFSTRVHDFTDNVSDMYQWLSAASANGGGDQAECVATALHDILGLKWRDNSTKLAVLISDAPPHGLGSGGDGFPNGDPSGHDPIKVAKKLAQEEIVVYVVGCEPAIKPFEKFFHTIAYMTGGQYFPLKSATLLGKVILGGVREELDLNKLMDELEENVEDELEDLDLEADEELIVNRVHDKMQKKGHKLRKANMLEKSVKMTKDVLNLEDFKISGGGYESKTTDFAPTNESHEISQEQVFRMVKKYKSKKQGK
ncbi:hypothetical protein SNEBB_010857, partial [Seison nebaliae]